MLRTLRRAANHQTRPLFSSNSTGLHGLPTKRRTSKEIILLFRKIVGFLKHVPEKENILGYVNRELDQTLPNVRSPQCVYERVITFLVSRKYAQEAVLVYKRMHQAGLMSSNVLDAKMLGIALAVPTESPQHLILRLAPIFTDLQYTDKDFSGLLKTMTKYGVDKDIICTLVETFIATRGPNYIIHPEFLAPLLSARTRSGDVDVALEVLDQFSGANQLNRAARASVHAPYVQVLAAIQETRAWDSVSVNKVLDLMMAQGLAPNLATINILLSRVIRLGNHREAIAMYSMLKGMRTTRGISPDSYTFGSMFLLYRMIRPKAVRKHHQEGFAFPPRALYHDFMLAVKPKGGHMERIVPSTTLLNVILRAFIRQRDYAGAFVVLNSYSLFNVLLDHRTYYRVVKHVVRRIWLEISKQHRGDVRWSSAFLGVQDYRQVELNEDLVQNFLAFVSQDTFHLVSPLYASRHHIPPSPNADGKYKLPSMEMMESVFLPDPQDFYYHPIPLKRILRRAVLANLRLADDNAGSAEVSKAIADAKADMLPKIPQRAPSSVSMDARRDT